MVGCFFIVRSSLTFYYCYRSSLALRSLLYLIISSYYLYFISFVYRSFVALLSLLSLSLVITFLALRFYQFIIARHYVPRSSLLVDLLLSLFVHRSFHSLFSMFSCLFILSYLPSFTYYLPLTLSYIISGIKTKTEVKREKGEESSPNSIKRTYFTTNIINNYTN